MSASASSPSAGARASQSRPAAALVLVRPVNLIIAACATLVGAWLQAERGIRLEPACWAAAAVLAAVAGANAFNDWVDRRADAINRPRRPVPSGALSSRAALVTALISYAVAIGLATRVSVVAVDIVLLWVLVTVAYSLALKGVPILGNVVAAAVTASVLYLGSISQGRPVAAPVPAALVLALLFNLAREFAKDAEDVAGDTVQGVRTLATVRGAGAALLAARATIIAAMLAVLVPFAFRVFGLWYGVISIGMQALLVFALWSIVRSGDDSRPGLASALLKTAMVVGLVAVSLGIL